MKVANKEEEESLSLTDFASNSTLHGFNKTCDANSNIIRRTVWIVILISAVGAYVFLMITSILKYYRYDTNTKISELTAKQLKFPAVSICQQNQFDESFVQNYPHLRYWMQYLETNLPYNLTADERDNATNVLEQHILWNNLAQIHPNFMKRCEFDGMPFECADYFTYQMSEISMCATFMSRAVRDRLGPWKTNNPGYWFGLSKSRFLQDMFNFTSFITFLEKSARQFVSQRGFTHA